MNEIKQLEDIVPINDAERLLLLRKRLNFKQYEFARELEVSLSYYLRIENECVPFTEKFRRRLNRYINKLYEMERI